MTLQTLPEPDAEPPKKGSVEIEKPQTISLMPENATVNTTITTENAEDKKARHLREAADADSERKKNESAFYYFLRIYSGILILAVLVAFFGPDPATKQMAFTLLTGMVTSLGGYFAGTATASKEKKK